MTTTLAIATPVTVTWYFDGYDTPALDPRLDPVPPTVQGCVQVVVQKLITGDHVSWSDTAEAIYDHYRAQGITGSDMGLLTARDVLDRRSLAEIRARATIPTQQVVGDQWASRGCARDMTPRGITTDPIPVEPPPLP